MPRLTSFFEDSTNEPKGSEWQIFRHRGLIGSLFARPKSRAEERTVQLGKSPEEKGREISLIVRNHQKMGLVQVFEVALQFNGQVVRFEFRPDIQTPFWVSLNSVSIRRVGARISVEVADVGKAIYREVWKDSDRSAGIRGFVDVECDEETNREALVWLAGTLGTQGLPIILGD